MITWNSLITSFVLVNVLLLILIKFNAPANKDSNFEKNSGNKEENIEEKNAKTKAKLIFIGMVFVFSWALSNTTNTFKNERVSTDWTTENR